MASKVAIYNMALSRLGTRARVADPDEESVEAENLSVWFDAARDATLRAHDWNFARRYLVLAENGGVTPPSVWAYAYSWPNDCLRFRGILPDMRPPVRFEVASALDGGSNRVKVIFSNAAQAEGWYTARIEDTELWDAGFTAAMAAVLAAHVALPITQNESLSKAKAAEARDALMQAAADDANESTDQVHAYTPETLAVRGITAGDEGV
jgi:hypothetical protein